jgi:hypothetical protein
MHIQVCTLAQRWCYGEHLGGERGERVAVCCVYWETCHCVLVNVPLYLVYLTEYCLVTQWVGFDCVLYAIQ